MMLKLSICIFFCYCLEVLTEKIIKAKSLSTTREVQFDFSIKTNWKRKKKKVWILDILFTFSD